MEYNILCIIIGYAKASRTQGKESGRVSSPFLTSTGNGEDARRGSGAKLPLVVAPPRKEDMLIVSFGHKFALCMGNIIFLLVKWLYVWGIE
jgi:hypothetical protein